MNMPDQLVGLFGKVDLIDFKERKIVQKLFGTKELVNDCEILLLSMNFAGGPPLYPLNPDVEHGIELNNHNLVHEHINAVHHNPPAPIPNLTRTCTNCDDFVSSFFNSNLLQLPHPVNASTMSLYCAPVQVKDMFRALREKKTLHRMLLLDHVARSVEMAWPQASREVDRVAFENNKPYLQGKIAEYLLQHKDFFVEFVHSDNHRMPQQSMISSIIAQVTEEIEETWKCVGKNIRTDSMYDPEKPFRKWWKAVSKVLLIGAKDLDDMLLRNNIRSSNLNLLYGFYVTCSANPDREDITLQAYCEQATGQLFRQIEHVAAIEREKHINSGKVKVTLPRGVVLRENKRKRAAAEHTASLSRDDEPLPLPANAARKARDTAYWVKIDPQYLRPGVSRDWCAPGKVIGIFPTGARPPTVEAQVVCVVTSQPSSLELPQPFADVEEEPEGLYLEMAIAMGVQGRVPVIMEDDVLKRFYEGKTNRELFFTDQGRVDFEDDVNKINYSTAKFIGDAMFDAGRFDEHGQLKMEFQNVRAVHVFVSYRAVPESQIRGMIRDAVVYVKKRFVSLRLFSAVALLFVVALLCVVIVVWYLYALLFKELQTEHNAPVQVSGSTLRGTLSMMLHNTTFLASLGLTLQQMSFPLKLGNITFPLIPRVGPTAPFLPPFARNYKVGTGVSTVMPPPSANIPAENRAWVNVVHTMLMSTPPPDAIVVWSAKPRHKSVGVIQTVQRSAVYASYPGGVYYLNSNYGLDQTDYLLFSLGHQMFGAHHDYTNASHYPAFLNTRLLLHKESVLVVLDNAIELKSVRAVAAAVRGAGVVVITAREPLALSGAVYVDVEAHIPVVAPAKVPPRPESKPESNVARRHSSAPPATRSTDGSNPLTTMEPAENGSRKPEEKPAVKPEVKPEVKSAAEQDKKWSHAHSQTAAHIGFQSAAFHAPIVDPQSRENTREFVIDGHSEHIPYNNRFPKNVNKIVRKILY